MACFRGGNQIGSMLASVLSGHISASGSSYKVGASLEYPEYHAGTHNTGEGEVNLLLDG